MNRVLLLLLAVAAASPSPAQQLVCPVISAASGKPCELFHYHLQAYDPETKGFATFTGINQFASLSSCEQAREKTVRQNAAVVDYVKRAKAQAYEADRIGACHCDMTAHESGGVFLSNEQRLAQRRTAEHLRRRVRERLLTLNVSSDSELISGLTMVTPVAPMFGGARLVPLEPARAVVLTNSPADLRMTRAAQTGAPVAATIDLPLASITSAPLLEAPAAEASAVGITAPAAAHVPEERPAPVEAIQQSTVQFDDSAGDTTGSQSEPETSTVSFPGDAAADTPLQGELSPSREDGLGDPLHELDDAAEAFIGVETQRIRNVLTASIDVGDETGAKILEACMLRTQLLTNLRSLIQGSGARSRLAVAVRNARKEVDRLAVITRLFGEDIAPHWAAKFNVDVIVEPRPQIAGNPERVLRDSSGEFSDEQKKHALYLLLGRAPMTEEQQLWLIPLVDRFLQ
ncbi:MAG TPA: hypothetical protein VMT00_00470 [Thermoanaerobaculia bacterium]|nr:hypothetical protein [Thermoanaerobaculia bacterium]